MKIKIINPNTSEEMTNNIHATAKSCCDEETEIITVTPSTGPISIENFHDQALSVIGVMEEIHKGISEGFDGYIIAAACDPGLDVAREISGVPVVGIGEAAMHLASLVSKRFSIITVTPRIVPLIKQSMINTGLSVRCASIRSTKLSVLDTNRKTEQIFEKIFTESSRAICEDGAESICLGCSGMTHLRGLLEEKLKVPVIDGVIAAVKIVEALVGLNLLTSKVLTYAYPSQKLYKGVNELLHPEKRK